MLIILNSPSPQTQQSRFHKKKKEPGNVAMYIFVKFLPQCKKMSIPLYLCKTNDNANGMSFLICAVLGLGSKKRFFSPRNKRAGIVKLELGPFSFSR